MSGVKIRTTTPGIELATARGGAGWVLQGLGCVDDEDLTDDAVVRYLVADTVINAGSLGVEELRCQLGERTLTADEAAYLAYCRQRAAAVFIPRPDAAEEHWTPNPEHRPELAISR